MGHTGKDPLMNQNINGNFLLMVCYFSAYMYDKINTGSRNAKVINRIIEKHEAHTVKSIRKAVGCVFVVITRCAVGAQENYA